MIPRMISHSGLLVSSAFELNKCSKSFQGLVGFTGNYWVTKAAQAIRGASHRGYHVAEEVPGEWSFLGMCSWLSEGGAKGSDSYNHPFIPGFSLPPAPLPENGMFAVQFFDMSTYTPGRSRNSNVDHCFKSIEFVTKIGFCFMHCVFLFFLFFVFGHGAYEVLPPWPGIESTPLHWKVKSYPLDHEGSP